MGRAEVVMAGMMYWWSVDFGEVAAKAAYEAVVNRKMTMGSLTQEFEQRVGAILGVKHVVATSSGTAALTLALLEAGVGPGDEVIVPCRTWISTAHAPLLLGAKVVFADVEKDRPSIDPESVAKKITPRTRAIIPVHLNGRCAQLEALHDLARGKNIVIIEDACQALFSKNGKGEFLGTHSQAGCFSLSIGKAISSGQGGFVVTNDDDIAKRLVMARTHGTGDVTMAEWVMAGGNFRYWDLPAAVGLSQLDRWQERCEQVRRVYARYREGLAKIKGIRLLPVDMEAGELPLYVECLTPRRKELVAYLASQGIQARPYYANLNTAPQFDNAQELYPNSDIFAEQCLVLPCGPDRTAEEIDRVLGALGQFFRD